MAEREPRRVRLHAALIVVLAIALGLFSRKVSLGFVLWDKSLGDALYAVMVFGIAMFVRPSARSRILGVVAFVICFALELFQLTGVPKTLPRLLRAAIGDTFSWHDVACYAFGAFVISEMVRRFLPASARPAR
jgi:hypothetical protein